MNRNSVKRGAVAVDLIQTYVVPSDTDDVNMPGTYNGDSDCIYEICISMICGDATGGFLRLRPNNSDANLTTIYSVNTGASMVTASSAFAMIGESAAIGSVVPIDGMFFAKSGILRGGFFNSIRGVGSVGYPFDIGVAWNDNSTIITGFHFFFDGGSGVGIKTGSTFSIYRRKQ